MTSSSFRPYERQISIARAALRDGVFRPSGLSEASSALRMADRGLLNRDTSQAPIYSYTLKDVDKWPEPLKTLLEAHRAAVTAGE